LADPLLGGSVAFGLTTSKVGSANEAFAVVDGVVAVLRAGDERD